jgi:hypothetical protein
VTALAPTARWSLAIALVALLAAPHGASAQGGETGLRRGVDHLEQGALVVEVEDEAGAAGFRVFNGSRRIQTIRIELIGDALARVARVEPAEKNVNPGQTFRFDLTVEAAKPPLEGEVVALSTDGTLARRAVEVRAADGAQTEAPSVLPTKLTLGESAQGFDFAPRSVSSQKLAGVSAGSKSTIVGYVSSGGGGQAVVRLAPGSRLQVVRLDGSGEYTGTADLEPTAEEGALELTVRIRDGWGWAVLLLGLGLALAFGLEYWLTRSRPRRVVLLRLESVREETERRQREANQRLDRLTPEGRAPWRVPVVWEDAPNSVALLNTQRMRIDQGIRSAATEDERTRWGPDGEELKGLDENLAAYEALVNRCLELASEMRALWRSAESGGDSLAGTPLEQIVGSVLDGRVIADGKALENGEKEAQAARSIVDSLVPLLNRFRKIEQLAADNGKPEVARKAREGRQDMLATVATADHVAEYWKQTGELLKELRAAKAEVEPEVNQLLALTPALVFPAVASRGALPLHFVAPDDLQAPPILATPSTGLLRRNAFMDLVFAVASAAIVLASGLGTIYFADSTWGGTEDWIAAFVWGSTIQTALNLGRRVLPGAVKTLTSGG